MRPIRPIRLISPIILILLPLIVYLKTLPPSLLWVDSGTMVAAAYSLGIPNPPGFPVYMVASHLFTLLPVGTILFRMQLFTIVFAVLTLLLVYKIILTLITNWSNGSDQSYRSYLAAAFGSLALAFSYEFWSQAHNTDAFILTDFFLVLLLYLVLRLSILKQAFWEKPTIDIDGYKERLFWGFLLVATIFGVAAGTNPTISQLVPAVLFVLYLNRRFISLQQALVQLILFVLLAVLVYSYLPLRAGQSFVNWGNPNNFSAILHQMVGSGLNVYAPEASVVNGFTGSPAVFFQSLTHYFWNSAVIFTPLLLPFLFLGFSFVWKKDKQIFFFLLIPVVVNMLYGALYFSGNQESWFIASYIIFAIFIGLGFYSVSALTRPIRLIGLISLICLFPLVFWFPILNRDWHSVTSDYATNLYLPLGKNALLLGTGDLFGSLSYYMKVVDSRRQDVTPIIVNQFYFSKWLRDNIHRSSDVIISEQLEKLIADQNPQNYNLAMNQFIADNIDRHPIYVLPFIIESSTFPGDPRGRLMLDERFEFMPHGLTMQVVKKGSAIMPYFASFEFKFATPNFPDQKPTFLEKSYNRIQGDVIYQYARAFQAAGDWWMFTKENPANAFYWYKKSREVQPVNPELMLRFGYYWAAQDQYDSARQYFEKAVSLSSNNPTYHYFLGNSYLNLGRAEEASREAQILETLAPDSDMAKQLKQQLEGKIKQ